MKLEELNQATLRVFEDALADIYESSRWVAQKAASARPFASIAHLAETMRRTVDEADDRTKQTLIDAHPDLAGKAARAGRVTAASAREQGSAGLDALTDSEYARFLELNRRYRARFGFPFILAVRGHDKTSILAAFERRLHNEMTDERAEALRQIHRIAQFRLSELIES